MVFNALAFNHDDHTKNFSFMLENGIWKLAPAYDLIFAYDPKSFWLKNHNININGKNNHITSEDLLAVGEKFGIKKGKGIFLEIGEVVRNFRDYAEKYGYPPEKAEVISAVIGR